MQWVKNLSIYSLVRQQRKVGRFGTKTTSNGRLFHMGMVWGLRGIYLHGWNPRVCLVDMVSHLCQASAAGVRDMGTSFGASCCFDGQQGTPSQTSRLHCSCCENGCKCILQPSSEPFPVCFYFQLYVGSRPWRHIPDEALLGIDMLVFLEFGMLS